MFAVLRSPASADPLRAATAAEFGQCLWMWQGMAG